jgi:hypothetical protein
MAAPVMATRGLLGLFARIGAQKAVARGIAVSASRAVGNIATNKGTQSMATDAMEGVVKRKFGSYFTQILQDTKATFSTSAYKDGIINTLKANWQHQLKHNMGGMLWGLGLPIAISLLTGFKGAWQAAVEEPNWLAKPFKFVNLAIPAAVGALTSVAYMALFPKAKGIPAMLMQNMTYAGGEFIAGNIVQKPKPALAPSVPAGSLTPEQQQQQATLQQQMNALQQQQNEQLAKTMQSIQQMTSSNTPVYNPTAVASTPSSNSPTLPQSIPPTTATVNPSIASMLGIPVADANYLNQSLVANGGLSLESLMKSNGLG